jgi:ABC-2 type transport system permease protein
MVFFVYIVQLSGTTSISVQQVALGNALQAVTFSTVFAICSIPGNEKHGGTLPLLMTTPTRIYTVIAGQSLFQILTGIISVAFSLAFAAVAFGVSFANMDAIAVVVIVLVTTFAMTGFGLMLSSLGVYLRSSTLLASLFLYVGLIFCGVNFPVSQLPTFLQPISYALPMTYGIDSLRMAVDGASLLQVAPSIVAMLVIGLIMMIAGYLMFDTFEKMARKKGATELF